MRTQDIQGVTFRIGDLDLQGVLFPDGRIDKPVVDGCTAFCLLHKIPGTVFRNKIDGERYRDGVQLRVETQRKVFFVRAFRFHHILAFELFLEQAELDVIREEPGITDRPDRIDRQAVFPGRILPGRQFEGRDDDRIQESDILARLVEFIVAVHIVQSENMIGSGSDITDRELPFVICSGSTDERKFHECGIFQVVVQTDRNAWHWFEVLGIQQDS